MKSISTLVERYRHSLSKIDPDVRSRVNRPGGLSEHNLLDLILNPKDYGVLRPDHPTESDVQTDYDREKCFQLGTKALDLGQVAYCIMAGGAGTRIGEPKALLRIPDIDMSLLTLKLMQAQGAGPIWVVVSPGLRDRIVDHVRSQAGLEQERIHFVEQYEAYRLTPDNQISLIDGHPELYPCGHGDLFPALAQSGLVPSFIAAGGQYISIVNVDNAAAALDPVVVGRHIDLQAKVSCEVVKRSEEDAGGVLCNVDGTLQIVEGFRISGVDPKKFEWLNTNSFIINAELNIKPLGVAWNRVQKNIENRVVIQYERLLQEITEAYDTKYLAVERQERFTPIKKVEDLISISERFNVTRRYL